MSKKDGGPAFPVIPVADARGGIPSGFPFPAEGMALRDYFAAKAMQGFCANPAVFAANGQCGWKLVNATEEQLAEYCGSLADAMLAERDK